MPKGYLQIPDWFSFENQGAGVAAGDLTGQGKQDLLVITVDNPDGPNRGMYRIGRNLDAIGNPAGGWSPWIDVPDWFSWENQGVGAALFDLDKDGRQDLLVFMIDNPPGQNQGFYRVGKKLDADGNVTGGWGPWIPIPDWFSFGNQYGGITVADLDQDGNPELIVVMVDNPPGQNRGMFRIGRKLDANGNVTENWTPWIDVDDWFSWENQGAAVTAIDLDNNGKLDLLFFQIDNAIEQNQAFYKVAHDVDINGNVAAWSLWRGIPAWFAWENQGGGIAALRHNGKLALIAMMVDSPPGQNAGYYRVLPLDVDPARDGQWELLPFHSGVLAVHAALLPKGKVLFLLGLGAAPPASPRRNLVTLLSEFSPVWFGILVPLRSITSPTPPHCSHRIIARSISFAGVIRSSPTDACSRPAAPDTTTRSLGARMLACLIRPPKSGPLLSQWPTGAGTRR